MPKTEPAAEAAEPAADAREFIGHWQTSGGVGMTIKTLIPGLCGPLGLPQSNLTVANEDQNDDVFENAISCNNGGGTTSTGRLITFI